MPSASWTNGWVTGDVVTAAEFKKGVGAISDSTLGVAAATISISSIVGSYAHLRLVIVGRGDSGSVPAVALRFNGDSGTNYQIELSSAVGVTVSTAEGLAQTTMQLGVIPGVSDVANAPGTIEAFIPGYAGTTFHKTVQALNAYKTATGTGGQVVRTMSGTWASTAAITSITISLGAGNFVAGTRATLYAMGA